MEQDRSGEGQAADTRRKAAYIAIIVLLLCGVGYYAWGQRDTKEEVAAPTEAPSIGVIDMRKVVAAHRVAAEIAQLEAECKTLTADLERLLSVRRAVSAPPLDEAPFRMAEEQKERQQLRLEQAALKKAQGEAMERWVQEQEPIFIEKRKAVEAEYQNRIVNIEIKLDNSKAMGLSDEEQDRLYQSLETLRGERAGRIREVFESYIAARNAYMQSLILKDASAAVGDAAAVRADALEKQAEAERRNTENMQAEMQDVELATIIREKRAALAAKLDEIRILEEHIRRDIESRAEKLAILHHADIIYAGNVLPYTAGLPGASEKDTQPVMMPIGQVVDLTDELIKELSE